MKTHLKKTQLWCDKNISQSVKTEPAFTQSIFECQVLNILP